MQIEEGSAGKKIYPQETEKEREGHVQPAGNGREWMGRQEKDGCRNEMSCDARVFDLEKQIQRLL